MNMDTDSRQGFSLPNTEGDSNLTPGGGGVISLGGSSVECCKKSTCATDDDITADEEDLINRLYNLLGHRWPLIAGRFPWRRVEEIENYCKIKWPQDGYTVSTSCSRS